MSEAHVSPLRVFLLGLAQEAPGPIPRSLRALARGVLGRTGSAWDIDDLVSEFVVRLIDATRSNRAGSVRESVKMPEPRLRAVIRHRLRQICAEQCPRWKLVKAIREHVQAALRLPELSVEVLPLSVVDGTRIRLDRIREATAWLKIHSSPAPRSGREVAGRIIELYFPRDGTGTVMHLGVGHSEDELLCRLDAPVLAWQLVDDLGRDQGEFLVRRLLGASLGDLAAERGVALSTAHGRMQKATERVRAQVRRHQLHRVGLEAVLERLSTWQMV